MSYKLYTSESVTEGHPDKVCDMIAGAILDAAIRASAKKNKHPRVAMEVSAKGDLNKSRGALMLFGEVTLPHGVSLDFEKIARQTIKKIGYDNPTYGFWYKLHHLHLHITEQSKDISHGVSRKKTGAGDQGLMFGGAIANDGPELMPLPIMLAHALTRQYTKLFKSKKIPYLRPDGKSQVVIAYDNGKPIKIESITIAASHDTNVTTKQLRTDIVKKLITPVLEKYKLHLPNSKNIIVNGAGLWTVFGPLADAGTTNRKIIVDSYGGAFPHGGGGFNGKDWTKVDVSGAVAARYVAKALVANKLARKVQVVVSYTIGQPNPMSVRIETFGTENVSEAILKQKAQEALDLSVDGIINTLHLAQPIYTQTASGGWFGRSEFPWEQVPDLGGL